MAAKKSKKSIVRSDKKEKINVIDLPIKLQAAFYSAYVAELPKRKKIKGIVYQRSLFRESLEVPFQNASIAWRSGEREGRFSECRLLIGGMAVLLIRAEEVVKGHRGEFSDITLYGQDLQGSIPSFWLSKQKDVVKIIALISFILEKLQELCMRYRVECRNWEVQAIMGPGPAPEKTLPVTLLSI